MSSDSIPKKIKPLLPTYTSVSARKKKIYIYIDKVVVATIDYSSLPMIITNGSIPIDYSKCMAGKMEKKIVLERTKKKRLTTTDINNTKN